MGEAGTGKLRPRELRDSLNHVEKGRVNSPKVEYSFRLRITAKRRASYTERTI